ncbi:hypothetical protein B0H17DRAFT_1325637 [Mycena rosella]|uniref:Cyclin N-terminal domain-containing protein n=1 Tax=Mycena rosella TaxID=1033263 RepID=A0AAD7GWI7_MYCRO|nr:hypothetical protein B0H17DRAFT_1325637 [Mycena rosella]
MSRRLNVGGGDADAGPHIIRVPDCALLGAGDREAKAARTGRPGDVGVVCDLNCGLRLVCVCSRVLRARDVEGAAATTARPIATTATYAIVAAYTPGAAAALRKKRQNRSPRHLADLTGRAGNTETPDEPARLGWIRKRAESPPPLDSDASYVGSLSVPRPPQPTQKMFSSPASDSSSSASSSSTFGSSSSSMSSTRSSPVHAASLVDPALHSPALLQLVDIKLTRPVIEYVVDCVSETVDYALGRTTLAPSARGRTRSPYHAKFTTFVSTVLARAEVTPPTVLTALVYVARARPHLSIALEEWALERVFLGALIAASKYTNDSTLKNVHWALCTGVFGKRDVGRIEREFLGVLDWELGVSEADLMAHHAVLLAGSGAAVPRPRAHTRHLSVPELEPSSRSVSSSSSSSASSSSPSPSPRTPAHLSPSHLAPPQKADLDVDMHVEVHPTLVPHKSGSGKLHDFLRSLHHGHHHHHHVRVAA